MATLERRLAMRAALQAQGPGAKGQGAGEEAAGTAQRTEVRSQRPEKSAAAVVEADTAAAMTVERGVPDALGFEADAPWPGAADETAFLAEQRVQNGPLPAIPVGPVNETADSSPMPPLEELVQRIPAEAREALEDLYRAKFIGVRRVAKKSLKS